MKELNIIQTKLNAPKDKFNKFGNYAYRSAEGIMEALKPLLKETECSLTIADEIVVIADRIYVKATATLTNPSGESVSTTAFAREEASKKGMDSAQVTGATSSYARKYALNGLFCIDDNKDPDTEEYANQQKESKPAPAPQQRQFNPEPVQTPPLESQNISVAGLFPTDMPDTIMDDLTIKINAATTDIALKGIFQDAKVLLAKRPDDLAAIKTAIIKKQRSMSNGTNS